MTSPLVLKLDRRDRLTAGEARVLEDLVVRVREVGADEDLVREGDRPNESSLLLDGWAARYKVLAGGTRQITELHVRGDFVDLHSFLLKRMDHGVVTLTPCRFGAVPHEALLRVTEEEPHLTRLLWLNALIDAAIHREAMTSLGRRSALARLAHILCEVRLRLEVVGLTEGLAYRFPLTQAEIGDLLGLSTVHVNRMIQELRAAGVISWRGADVVVEDWERLTELAEFDPAYLDLKREPR